MSKLPLGFYLREDVVQVAKDLLGKYLYTNINGEITAGIITETEAYAGAIDKASHAYNNRRTKRTEVMFQEGGTAYVYLCYGIHHLFNVVTNYHGTPHAVLVRAVKPVSGIETILKRRNMASLNPNVSAGPGTVSQALGIHTSHTGLSLLEDSIWIEDKGFIVKEEDITSGPRVGIDYAEEDAHLPYRFRIFI